MLGLLAFVMYALVLGAGALSMSRLRRWSADHIAADAALIVPLLFFGLLFIPVLSWWVAALIALAIGVVVVPFVVRWRTAHQARTAQQTYR
ncbi:hypothetical protein [Micromonospora globispora]|uniref:hypothetical protein n=1 Tax=Micromonospora globispora TaxID=1450148 RepID=UPI000F4FDB61|nr:hypothetical protein [Micromonospora globispora]